MYTVHGGKEEWGPSVGSGGCGRGLLHHPFQKRIDHVAEGGVLGPIHVGPSRKVSTQANWAGLN